MGKIIQETLERESRGDRVENRSQMASSTISIIVQVLLENDRDSIRTRRERGRQRQRNIERERDVERERERK